MTFSKKQIEKINYRIEQAEGSIQEHISSLQEATDLVVQADNTKLSIALDLINLAVRRIRKDKLVAYELKRIMETIKTSEIYDLETALVEIDRIDNSDARNGLSGIITEIKNIESTD